MKLNVHDRLILVQILSGVKDDFLTLDMVGKVISSLSLADKEYREFGINQVDGQIAWNEMGLVEREIEIGEKVTDITVEALKKLDESKQGEQKHRNLYKKFIVDKKER